MRIGRWRWSLTVSAVVLLGLAPARAEAQTDPRTDLRLSPPPTQVMGARGQIAAPAMSIGVPTAFGASWGDVFAGVGIQSRTRYADRIDGGLVVGAGFGNPARYAALEVSVSQFGTVRSCCRGGVSAKAHRMVGRTTSAAIGWENIAGWGDLPGGAENAHWTDGGSSLYGAVTHLFLLREESYRPFSTLAVTLGAGNGRLRREADILAERDRANVFGSVGVRVLEPVSVVASYTGQDVAAGVSMTPLRRLPIAVTLGAADLTTNPRFVVGAGLGFTYPF
jgi:hypothetical protein